jgi:hypothetical protein
MSARSRSSRTPPSAPAATGSSPLPGIPESPPEHARERGQAGLEHGNLRGVGALVQGRTRSLRPPDPGARGRRRRPGRSESCHARIEAREIHRRDLAQGSPALRELGARGVQEPRSEGGDQAGAAVRRGAAADREHDVSRPGVERGRDQLARSPRARGERISGGPRGRVRAPRRRRARRPLRRPSSRRTPATVRQAGRARRPRGARSRSRAPRRVCPRRHRPWGRRLPRRRLALAGCRRCDDDAHRIPEPRGIHLHPLSTI